MSRNSRKSSAPSTPKTPTSDKLFSWKYRFPIFLAVTIGMFNQFSGINAILYYINDIFAAAGYSKVSGDLQSVAIGATNLFFTMLAMTVIDKIGRKTLLLIGSVGTAFCLGGVAYIFFTHQHQSMLVWLLVGFHRLLRVLARRRHLGLHRRSLPESGPRQRAEPRQLLALVHERRDLARLPGHRAFQRRVSRSSFSR